MESFEPEKNINPEQLHVREIIESAQSARFAAMKEVLLARAQQLGTSPLFRKALNMVPGLGDVMMGKALWTRQEGGRELTNRERYSYAIVMAAGLLGYTYLSRGDFVDWGAMQVVTNVVQKGDLAVEGLKTAAKKFQAAQPRLAHMMESFAELVSSKISQPDFLNNALIALDIGENQ